MFKKNSRFEAFSIFQKTSGVDIEVIIIFLLVALFEALFKKKNLALPQFICLFFFSPKKKVSFQAWRDVMQNIFFSFITSLWSFFCKVPLIDVYRSCYGRYHCGIFLHQTSQQSVGKTLVYRFCVYCNKTFSLDFSDILIIIFWKFFVNFCKFLLNL